MFIALANSDPEKIQSSVEDCWSSRMSEWLISAFWKVASPLGMPQQGLLPTGYSHLQLFNIFWGNEGVQSVFVQISGCGRCCASGFWFLPRPDTISFCVVYLALSWWGEKWLCGQSSLVGSLGAVETGHGVMALNRMSISLG